MGKRLYIAYGSNLNRTQMAHRCLTAKVVGTAILKDYELLFRGGRDGAVATVEPKAGSDVPVLIWELKPRDEQALDVYEGFPIFYRKEMVEIRLNGKPESVMIYVMNEGRPLGTPNQRYYEIIHAGYTDAGFDIAVLEKAVKKCEG